LAWLKDFLGGKGQYIVYLYYICKQSVSVLCEEHVTCVAYAINSSHLTCSSQSTDSKYEFVRSDGDYIIVSAVACKTHALSAGETGLQIF